MNTDEDGRCGCTDVVADAACAEHGMAAFLRELFASDQTDADMNRAAHIAKEN